MDLLELAGEPERVGLLLGKEFLELESEETVLFELHRSLLRTGKEGNGLLRGGCGGDNLMVVLGLGC